MKIPHTKRLTRRMAAHLFIASYLIPIYDLVYSFSPNFMESAQVRLSAVKLY